MADADLVRLAVACGQLRAGAELAAFAAEMLSWRSLLSGPLSPRRGQRPPLRLLAQLVHACSQVEHLPQRDSAFWPGVWRPCCEALLRLGQLAPARDLAQVFAAGCKFQRWGCAAELAELPTTDPGAVGPLLGPLDAAMWLGGLGLLLGLDRAGAAAGVRSAPASAAVLQHALLCLGPSTPASHRRQLLMLVMAWGSPPGHV